MQPQRKTKFDNLPSEQLVQRADTLSSSGSHKDAIEIYKHLLKRERRQEWEQALATAYFERARGLAGKEMYKEAGILWENMARLSERPSRPDLYIQWSIRGGQYAKAARAYTEFETLLQASDAVQGLEEEFAALLLAGFKDVARVFHADSVLSRQFGNAVAALRAYCQGADEASVEERLKGISFRSPYRNFRQLLRALVKLESDPAGAASLIERIPSASPFAGLREVVRIGPLGRGKARALAKLGYAQREVAVSLLGFDKQQFRLIKQSEIAREKHGDKALFDFIMANLAALDREQARRACLALLPMYPKGLRAFERSFGGLSPFQADRLRALQAESDGDVYDVKRYWRACADRLAADSSHPDNALGAAFILRRIVDYVDSDEAGPGAFQDPDIVGYLEESLGLDPDDKDSYLRLARWCSQGGDKKAYHGWVEKAVKRFPEDPRVLLAAVETATERKAFKKAAAFASKVLELDPINTRARGVLIGSHLSHARKLIGTGKYALAEKELDTASELEQVTKRVGLIEMNRALLAFEMNREDEIRRWLAESHRLAGNPLLTRLHLWVESLLLNLEPEFFQEYLSRECRTVQRTTREEVLAFIGRVNAYREEGVDFLDTALEDLEPPLRKAGRLSFSLEERETICECLHRIPHYDLLEEYATQALKHWKHRPLFVYYQIYGRALGDIDMVSVSDYDRLENAWERANEAQDTRTFMLIDKFFAEDFGMFPSGFPRLPAGDDPLDALEQLREAFDAAPPALREALLDKLIDEFLAGSDEDDGIPRELKKMLLKNLVLNDADFDDDLFDGLPFPELPQPSRPKRKKKRRRK